jgi:hypothetical protein
MAYGSYKVRYDYLTSSYSQSVVSPLERANGVISYPMPTWKAKSCMKETLYCSGHGTCADTGLCICDEHYYGKLNPLSCDTYCTGEMKDSICFSLQQYYIGGLLPYSISSAPEFISIMNLAVELINNKTDGWFDDTLQVSLTIQINNSDCDPNVAYEAVLYQSRWAQSIGGRETLDGMIGDLCSGSRYSPSSVSPYLSLSLSLSVLY